VSAEQFAHLSNLAIYSATVVYALALLVHIAEWASAREVHHPEVTDLLVPVGSSNARPGISVETSGESSRPPGEPGS
jgi:hypothetical protein